MMQSAIIILLWFCAIGCGLIAGLYFAFSTFVMTALGRIDQAQGIAAMNSINSVILGSLFMPLFFGTTIACVLPERDEEKCEAVFRPHPAPTF